MSQESYLGIKPLRSVGLSFLTEETNEDSPSIFPLSDQDWMLLTPLC